MSATPFQQIRRDFPDITLHLMLFFDMDNMHRSERGFRQRTVTEFFEKCRTIYGGRSPQPYLIVQMCQKLTNNGWITETQGGGIQGIENRYIAIIHDKEAFKNPSIVRMLNCIVFGFAEVFDNYSNSVLPIINWNDKNDPQIGTCFVVSGSECLTATHCLHPASALALKGVSADAFRMSKFFSHSNEALDITLVQFSDQVFQDLAPIPLPKEGAEILEEVVALGYPNVPGFHPTIAAEAASISARLSVTRGRVASVPSEYFSQAELFLITARVRGGFSGGPVLNAYGEAVGIVSREPAADANPGEGQRYDDLGYGTVIPAKTAVELRNAVIGDHLTPLDTSYVEFREFE